MPISEALKAVYALAPTTDYYIETLELEHSQFEAGRRYITNQLGGWTALLEDGITEVTYEFLPFAAIPPSSAEENNINLKVAIDNASQELMDQLENLGSKPDEPILCRYRVYLSSDTQTVQNDPPLKLDIMAVSATNDVLTFTAGLANLRGIPFPGLIYSTERFPGLKR